MFNIRDMTREPLFQEGAGLEHCKSVRSSISPFSRWKSVNRALFASSLILCALLFSDEASAKPEVDSRAGALGVRPAIDVISTDGKKWTHLRNSTVELYGNLRIDPKNIGARATTGYTIFLGVCNAGLCSSPAFRVLDLGASNSSGNTLNETISVETSPAEFPGGGNGVSPNVQADNLIRACNSLLENGRNIYEDREISTSFDVTVRVHLTSTAPGLGVDDFNIDDHWKVAADVRCKQIAQRPSATGSDAIQMDQGPFKSENIKLFLATVNGANTDGPSPANTCPALRVTTRVETNQRGSVDVKLWRESRGNITSEIQNLQSFFDADRNGFFAESVKWERFDNTTPVQYRAELIGSTFAPQTEWKNITIHCTGAGGGGLATPDNDPLPDQPTDPDRDVGGADDLAEPQLPDPNGPRPSWVGELTIADSAGRNHSCPRAAQLVVKARRDEPGDLNYRVSCSDGKLYQGTASAFNQGGIGWEAFAAHGFNVNKTRKISCNLQEIKPSGAPVSIATGSHDFVCANPNFDPPTDDLSSGPTETPKLPSNILIGDFSFIDNGSNRCPRNVKALINFQLNQDKNVHYSLDCQSGSYSGVAQLVAKDGGFIAPAVQTLELPNGANGQSKLTCALKTVSPGKPKLHTAKARTFKCINPNVDAGSNDLNASGNDPSSGSTTPEPAQPKPKISVCKNGRISGGKCNCASNASLKKIGRFEYSCVKTKGAEPVRTNPDKPKKDPVRTNPEKLRNVSCNFGKVKNGKCDCSAGRQLRKLGDRKFECVAKVVRKNPASKKKDPVRANPAKVKPAVRANPKPANQAKLVCRNGKIKNGQCTCGPKRQLKKRGNSNFACAKK